MGEGGVGDVVDLGFLKPVGDRPSEGEEVGPPEALRGLRRGPPFLLVAPPAKYVVSRTGCSTDSPVLFWQECVAAPPDPKTAGPSRSSVALEFEESREDQGKPGNKNDDQEPKAEEDDVRQHGAHRAVHADLGDRA